MPAAIARRGQLVAFGAALFALAFVTLALWDVPRVGIAYFLYLPIALIALATSPLSGAAAGIAAAEMYALGSLLASEPGTPDVMTTTGGLRLLTYAAIGMLIGKFAADHRTFARRLRELAQRDGLTGLLNARAYEAFAGRLMASGEPFSLVLVDMDGLKELNDEQGHAAGNEALKQLAVALAASVRRGDEVARIGGDEFAVLAPGTGEREAAALRDRLGAELERRKMAASLGSASYPADAADARTLFERADRNLYEHKALRRAARHDAMDEEIPASSGTDGHLG